MASYDTMDLHCQLTLYQIKLLQAHVRGTIVRRRMKDARAEFQDILFEIHPDRNLQPLWIRQTLCLPQITMTPRQELYKPEKHLSKQHNSKSAEQLLRCKEMENKQEKPIPKETIKSRCETSVNANYDFSNNSLIPDSSCRYLETNSLPEHDVNSIEQTKISEEVENLRPERLQNCIVDKNCVEYESAKVEDNAASSHDVSTDLCNDVRRERDLTNNAIGYYNTNADCRDSYLQSDKRMFQDKHREPFPRNEDKTETNTPKRLTSHSSLEQLVRGDDYGLTPPTPHPHPLDCSSFTDVTSVWDSILSSPDDSRSDPPLEETVTSLQQQRQNIAMELLWVQQAILSRKNLFSGMASLHLPSPCADLQGFKATINRLDLLQKPP